MTNAIFHEEMTELYIKKDAAYKESVQTARDALVTRITAMENSDCTDPVIEQKLRELSQTLEQIDGRHVYGYLPKEVKAQGGRDRGAGWRSSRRWRPAMSSGGS